MSNERLAQLYYGQRRVGLAQHDPLISSNISLALCGNTGHNINTDPSYSRTMDTDMALSNSLGPEDTMVPGGSIGQSDQHDSGGGMAQGTLTPAQLQVMVLTQGFCVVFGGNTDLGHIFILRQSLTKISKQVLSVRSS